MTSGWTAIPNHILDNMANMSGSIFQVCCTVARKTAGYTNGNGERKEWDRISTSQFMDATGLSNRSVIDAISKAIEGSWIERKKAGQWYEYRIKPMKKVHRLEQETCEESSQEPMKKVHSQPMKKVHTQKKRVKQTSKQTDTNVSAANAGTTPQQDYFNAVCKIIGWDHKIISKKNRGQVAQLIGILQKNNYTIEELRKFYKFWFQNDWRGQKGQYPTLSQLREEIGKIRADPTPPARAGPRSRVEASLAAVDEVEAMLKEQGVELP